MEVIFSDQSVICIFTGYDGKTFFWLYSNEKHKVDCLNKMCVS